MSAPKLSKQEVALLDAKGRLADIFVSLTGTDEKDEQAFAEFCAEAEGLLEDWLEARAPISEQERGYHYVVNLKDRDDPFAEWFESDIEGTYDHCQSQVRMLSLDVHFQIQIVEG